MHLRMTSGVVLVVLFGTVSARAAERPSFDCAKAATAAERAICTSDRLARLDRALAAAYRQLGAELSVAGETFVKEQSAFLARRDACGSDVSCLARHMEERLAALRLKRQSKPGSHEALVGRYKNRYGWMIVRRTLDGEYELTGQTADPGGRWACDVSGKIKSIAAGIATVEAGEENDSRPLSLKVGRDILTIAEDADRRLAGYTCGVNGSVEGDYRRVQRLR